MTDPIKALIAAARESFDAMLGSTDAALIPARRGLAVAILNAEAAQQAAAEARPEPKPDPALRNWTEDFCLENGNYESLCIVCTQKFYGNKRRTCCKACAYPPARPEPAAEPSDKVAIYLQAAADCRMNKTTDDWQELTMMYLSDAVEALAREVRRVR